MRTFFCLLFVLTFSLLSSAQLRLIKEFQPMDSWACTFLLELDNQNLFVTTCQNQKITYHVINPTGQTVTSSTFDYLGNTHSDIVRAIHWVQANRSGNLFGFGFQQNTIDSVRIFSIEVDQHTLLPIDTIFFGKRYPSVQHNLLVDSVFLRNILGVTSNHVVNLVINQRKNFPTTLNPADHANDLISFDINSKTFTHRSHQPFSPTASPMYTADVSDSQVALQAPNGVVDIHDHAGQTLHTFYPHYRDNPFGGVSFTGAGGRAAVAYFDSSLYVFTTTHIQGNVPDSFNVTHSAMLVDRLNSNLEHVEREVIDTVDHYSPYFTMAVVNGSTSVTPDGQRLYALGQNFSTTYDTMYWHIYSYAPGFEHVRTLHIPWDNNASWAGVPFTILATSDGGALIYGLGQGFVPRLYKLEPDSAYTPLSQSITPRRAVFEPFAYPNPTGTDGRVTIATPSCTSCPLTTAHSVQAFDQLGRVASPAYTLSSDGSGQLNLPAAQGIYTLILRDVYGALLATQRVVRR